MKNHNEMCISFETAKLLKDCKIKSKFVYSYNYKKASYDKPTIARGDRNMPNYPAYTWKEIEDNADKFFGKRGWVSVAPISVILCQLSLKKYYEADIYFRRNCIIISNK